MAKENGETVEAGARIVELKPYALYNLTFVNQVYIMFFGIPPEQHRPHFHYISVNQKIPFYLKY